MEQQGADRNSKKQRREKLSNMQQITDIRAKFEHVNFELTVVQSIGATCAGSARCSIDQMEHGFIDSMENKNLERMIMLNLNYIW